MSDARLRELERSWRESGALDDAVRWLQERVRQGDLSPERLELAAFLNHAAALGATGLKPTPSPVDDPTTREAWSDRLVAAGWAPAFRAGVADARQKESLLQRAEVSDLVRSHHEACLTLVARRLEAVEDWILAGGPEASDRPEQALVFQLSLEGIVPPPATEDALVPWAYGQALEVTSLLATRSQAGTTPPVGTWWSTLGPDPDEPANSLAAIQREVSAWALGTHDPLRLRLERIEVSSPCPVEWDSLEGAFDVRRCGACRQNVYDLSALDRATAAELIGEREGKVCVRFFRREDGKILTRDCSSGLQDKLEPYRLPPPTRALLGRIRIT